MLQAAARNTHYGWLDGEAPQRTAGWFLDPDRMVETNEVWWRETYGRDIEKATDACKVRSERFWKAVEEER